MDRLLIRSFVMISAGLALLLTAPVVAQDVDILGVFFDEAGTQTSTVTTEPGQLVPIYLVLQNPSHDDGIHAWECILEGRSDAPIFLASCQYRGGGANYDQPPRFYVDLGTPLPSSETVVLMSALALVLDPATEVLFYLHPYDPPSLQDPPGYGYPVTTPLYRYGDEAYQPLGWSSGCETEPVVRINDDGVDPVSGLEELPEELPFGYVPAGQTAYRNITLRNAGDVALSGRLSISGEGFRFRYGGPYWTDEPKWFRIEAGSHLTVEMEVQSSTDEPYTGELGVTVCGETTTIVLSTQGPGLHCWIDPPLLDFGEVDLSYPHTLYRYTWIYNIGSLALWIDITEDCPDFSATLQGGTDTPIPPGESRRLRVAFDPSESGPQTCAIALGNDACADLTCTAMVTANIPICVVTPEAWDYGEVAVGTMIPKTFSVRNAGGGLMAGQVMPPPDHFSFSLMDGAEPFSLAHGEIHEFTVAFKPHAEGNRGCEIDVTGGCGDVYVEGTAVAYVESCTVEPASLDFHDVWIGSWIEREFVVSNQGTTFLTGNLELSGLQESTATDFTLSETGPFTLNPGEEWTIRVRCEPLSLGNFVGFVTTGLPGAPLVLLTARAIEYPAGGCWHYEDGDAGIISTLAAYAGDIAVSDGIACTAAGGLRVYDITSPQHPTYIGHGQVSNLYSTYAVALDDTRRLAYLTWTRYHFDFHHGSAYIRYMSAFDILDPTNPPEIATIGLGGGWDPPVAMNLTVIGDLLFVIEAPAESGYHGMYGPQTFGVYDVSNPHEPSRIYACSGSDVAVAERYAYLVTPTTPPGPWTPPVIGRLRILNIADPTAIEEVGQVQMEADGRTIAVHGESAYVTDVNGDLQIFDVSEPTRPFLVGNLTTPGDSWEIEFVGEYLYVTAGELGVQVYEIAASSAPSLVSILGSVETPGPAGHIAFNSQYGYVTGGGLHTIWQQCGTDDLAAKDLTDVPVAELRLAIHPNPFNPQTTIVCEIPQPGAVRVRIFDLRGRLTATLVDEVLPGGRHEVVWNGRDTAGRQVASGTYLCRLESPRGVRSQKLALIR